MKKLFTILCALSLFISANATVQTSGEGWELSGHTLLIHSLSVFDRLNKAWIIDYNWDATKIPWYSVRNQIQTVTIYNEDNFVSENGITYFVSYIFADMTSLRIVQFNADVDKIFIYSHAFENSTIQDFYQNNRAYFATVGAYAFKNCRKLVSFTLSDVEETSKQISEHAFEGCTSLKSVYGKLAQVDAYAFKGCTALETIDLSNVWAIRDHAFDGCTKLRVLKAKECMTIGNYAFRECNLASISLKDIQDFGDYAFYYAIQNDAHLYIDRPYAPSLGTDAFFGVSLPSVTLHIPDNSEGYNVAPWTNFRSENRPPEIYATIIGNTVRFYYDDQRVSRSGIPWENSTVRYQLDHNTPEKIVIDETMSAATPTNMDYWFQNFKNAKSVENLSYLNTSEVTDMGSLFFGCTSLQTIDLNALDMSAAQDIRFMFSGCSSLQKIYCEKDWSQMSNITNGFNMFEGCTSLVGGRGTAFDSSNKGLEYARPDGGSAAPGYFWSTGDDGINHEDIEQIVDGQSSNRKFIKDGQLFIERNGKTYNANGVELK